MRRVASVTLQAVGILLSSSWAFAQGTPSGTSPGNPCPQHTLRPGCESATPYSTVSYTFCETSGIPAPGKPTIYYASEIFLIDMAPYTNAPQPPPGTSPFPWMNEFTQYVSQTYAHGGKVTLTCTNSNTEAEAQANLDTVMRSGTPGRLEVEQTGWKYAPSPPIKPPVSATAAATAPAATPAASPVTAAAAPPATAAAPPSATAAQPLTSANSAAPQPPPATSESPPPAKPAKRSIYGACWAEVKARQSAYFSAVFEAPGIAGPREEFRRMVLTSYGTISRFSCEQKPSSAEAEQELQQWKDAARAKDTIVDTGWRP